ncbi:MAG: LD-carboxypeptidase [Burkholderiaceae bacterium]|nr:MAG: LD-carboxypeptidase [Burkholderiaceae bacterium]
MSHIYIYSPAGAVQDRAAFRRGIQRLTKMGHQVEIDPNALTRWQRFAGDDATRIAAIRRAAASSADVALITRGGYGLTRILPQIPWDEIAAAVHRGTRFVGFSDFTALQLGLLAKAKAITWAGPALCEGFGAPKPLDAAKRKPGISADPINPITLACFEDLVNGAAEGVGWRISKSDLAALEGAESNVLAHRATLWGGNLRLITTLLGTPWFPKIRNGVLFLEDVGEHPYRIERMLSQLLYAGVLARQAAIVLGQFTRYTLSNHDRGYSLRKVVDRLRSQVNVPILTGLPFGHTPAKVLLPVGARIELVVEKQEAFLFWGHL